MFWRENFHILGEKLQYTKGKTSYLDPIYLEIPNRCWGVCAGVKIPKKVKLSATFQHLPLRSFNE